LTVRSTRLVYADNFFACFLTVAHRFFAAFAIAALPAADRTRFFTPTTSRSAEPPNAFADFERYEEVSSPRGSNKKGCIGGLGRCINLFVRWLSPD
jgi:hypothetical protein